MTLAELRQHQKSLQEAGPMHALHLRNVSGSFRDILDSGLLAGLSELDVANVPLCEEDIIALAAPVLRHRVLVNYRAEAEGVSVGKVIERVLENTK